MKSIHVDDFPHKQTLPSPKEIIFLCSSQDPPSPAVFAYWKHPIGPPAEHKAPGAQAAQRRSFLVLQPQCLWRSLFPRGLIHGLHKEKWGELKKGIKAKKSISSCFHRGSAKYMSCLVTLFLYWLGSYITTCQTDQMSYSPCSNCLCMLSISDLFPLTRYKPSVFRPEAK